MTLLSSPLDFGLSYWPSRRLPWARTTTRLHWCLCETRVGRGEKTQIDWLCSQAGEAKLRMETQILVCGDTLLCPPLDVPRTWIFLEEKDLGFNRDGI